MKKILMITGLSLLTLAIACFIGGQTAVAKKATCTAIQDGILVYSAGHYLAGQPLTIGNDIFGYNYQAHKYDGNYANAYLGKDGFPPYEGDDAAYLAANPAAEFTWYWPYRKDQVAMKWNDAWLSNKDCDGDGLLDRHYGYPAYVDSGAWLTNHQSGTYTGDLGQECNWNYFVKIVAQTSDNPVPPNPEGLLSVGSYKDGERKPIWGEFEIIQEVSNDACLGQHGLYYKSPIGPGLGNK